MKKEIDELLKQALTPNDEPNFWLNQKILNQAKENPMKNHSQRKKIPAVLLAALFILCFSITAFAAWKYLSPDSVSKKAGNSRLSEAFQSKDAITINETQQYQNLDITLLGLVSGKDITDYVTETRQKLTDTQTYAVVAIANADGTPMPAASDDAYADLSFFASPLIEGYDPTLYNAVTMNGGYQDIVEDGILYRICECDNVEIFADHTIYLCVSDSTFYNQDAYAYDFETGKISRSESYQGVNALFVLPLDSKKADPAAAAAYISQMEAAAPNDETISETDIDRFIAALTVDNINEYAVPVESTRQTLTPDKNGFVTVNYEYGDSSGNGMVAVFDLFPDGKPGMSSSFGFNYSDDGLKSLLIDTYTLNADGTVTFVLYEPK